MLEGDIHSIILTELMVKHGLSANPAQWQPQQWIRSKNRLKAWDETDNGFFLWIS
jgi:hypothetical protein